MTQLIKATRTFHATLPSAEAMRGHLANEGRCEMTKTTIDKALIEQVLTLFAKALDTDNVFGRLHNDAMDCICELRAALAEPAVEPVAWSMTYNGNHCGNFYESRTDAEERMADMNAKHPLDKRAIEPLYAAPLREPAQTTCNCRWEGDTQVQECTLHQAHKDAIPGSALRASHGQALRLLTQNEKDSLGRRAEGMDGNGWDQWVQGKFAQVNGLKVQGGSYE